MPAVDSMDEAAIELHELGDSGFALAVLLLRNRDDAADAVQDSFHTLLRKRRLFDPKRGQLRAWFLKIVRNRCLDMLRKRRRDATIAAELTELPATQETPDAASEKRETIEALKLELMNMPLSQREIILLRDYHNLSYADVARVMNIPVGTVMSRLHRARAELRRRMQAYG